MLNNLGRYYDALREYRKAIEYFEKGLAIRERVYERERAEAMHGRLKSK